MNDKEIRSDAKLKNLSAEQHEELWQLRNPAEEDEQKLTLEAIASEEVPRIAGFTCSLSSLSEFYSWLKQKRRTEAAKNRAEQAKLQFLKENPDATPEDISRLGQMIFMNETVEDGDIRGFVAVLKARNAAKKLALEERRVELLERKAQFADEVKKAAQNREGGITAEEMEEIERELKMM